MSYAKSALHKRRTKRSGAEAAETAEDRQARVYDHLVGDWPNIMGNAFHLEQLFYSLKVSLKSDGRYLAIMQMGDDDADSYICFGSGDDLISALDSLNRSISQDKWRWDKFRAERSGEVVSE